MYQSNQRHFKHFLFNVLKAGLTVYIEVYILVNYGITEIYLNTIRCLWQSNSHSGFVTKIITDDLFDRSSLIFHNRISSSWRMCRNYKGKGKNNALFLKIPTLP